VERNQKKTLDVIHSLRQAAYKHGYLIITAAWLYTISFIFSNYWSYYSSPQKVKSSLEQRLHRQEGQFAAVASDTALLAALIGQSSVISNPLPDDIGLFIYRLSNAEQAPPLIYWNTNRMYVDNDDVDTRQGSFFVGTQNGDFELIKKLDTIRGQAYAVFGMLPVRWSYFLENKYLHSDFAGYSGLAKQYEISADPSALPVINGQGEELFRIKLKEGKSFIAYDNVTILLRVLAIVLLMIFLHSVALEMVAKRGFRMGFLFLVAAVLVLRFITYEIAFPFDFSKLPLFDPSIYASNFLHPSLGDLFVNAILLFWLVSFINRSTITGYGSSGNCRRMCTIMEAWPCLH
jgi:two-component system nitrogen regulation sensor histidine kinase NtrY